MNSKKKFVILLVVFVLLMAGAVVLYNSLSDDVDTDKYAGNSDSDLIDAPDFTVYDKDMNPVKLSDFKGSPVVVSFWASWCGVCKAEMPDFDLVCDEYNGEVVFMMINVTDGSQETIESANDFLTTVDYTFPVYFDTTLEAGTRYGVSALPTTYFINSDGKLIGRGNYLDLATLRQAVSDILD